MEGMCSTVVDRVNNSDRKVEEPYLTLTKYRVHQTSSSSSPPANGDSNGNGNGSGNGNGNGKVKSKASGGVVEVVPEDSDRRQLEVSPLPARRYGVASHLSL